jgi:hypothetical protein
VEDIHFLEILGIWLEEKFKLLAISLECIPINAFEGDYAVIRGMQY